MKKIINKIINKITIGKKEGNIALEQLSKTLEELEVDFDNSVKIKSVENRNKKS